MPEWIDFGAPAACGAHRFRLEIPQASRAAVALYEDMGFAGDGSRPEGALLRARVISFDKSTTNRLSLEG